MVFGKAKRKRSEAAPREQDFHITHVEDASDSEEATPINVGDVEHNTQQASSNKPKLRESNLKPLPQEVTILGDHKGNTAGGSK